MGLQVYILNVLVMNNLIENKKSDSIKESLLVYLIICIVELFECVL